MFALPWVDFLAASDSRTSPQHPKSGYRWFEVHPRLRLAGATGQWRMQLSVAGGVPFRSVSADHVEVRFPDSGVGEAVTYGGVDLGAREDIRGLTPLAQVHLLALRPLVIGVAANAVAYMIALGMVFHAIRRLRAWVRWRQCLCSSCGYSLNGIRCDVCPECGMRVRRLGDESRPCGDS